MEEINNSGLVVAVVVFWHSNDHTQPVSLKTSFTQVFF